MSFYTDKKRVLGLGSAKDGVEHWWAQRLSAVALIPLTILFALTVAGTIGEDYATVKATFAHPFHAVITALFIIVVFKHLAQGLQVVIEDYVHGKGMRTFCLLANTLGCGLFTLIGLFAIGKIAFGG